MSAPRFLRRIRTRLVITYCVVTAAVFAVIGALFYFIARDALDDEMGRRLVMVAEIAAQRQSGAQLAGLQAGDEDSNAYRRAMSTVQDLLAIGAASRIYVFDAQNKSLVDSQTGVAIGTEYYRLQTHRAELRRALAGEPVDTRVFRGLDGNWYKSAFAPIRDGDAVAAVLAVEAGVPFFETLQSIKRNLLGFGAAATLLIVVVSVFMAVGLERPIARLLQSAERLGAGDLETAIEPTSSDEIGRLAVSLDAARRSIVERDRFLQMLQRGIAHEVRNPLGGMRLFCDILSDELREEPDKARHVDKIRREITGLENVVNEFLDFTRDVSLSPKTQPLSGFLRDLMAAYTDLESKSVELDLRVDPPNLEASFDAERLKRAMYNLVNNAVQAMPKGGRLTVRAERDRDMFEIIVADTGVGIPEKNLQQLFTPFFTTKDKGTGLGMPFAKKIVESHGGTIRVDSRPEAGTSVTLRMPVGKGKDSYE